jgi:hypothetical protein
MQGFTSPSGNLLKGVYDAIYVPDMKVSLAKYFI